MATDGQGSLQPVLEEKTRRLVSLKGLTEELGPFTVTFQPPTTEGGAAPLYARYVPCTAAGGFWVLQREGRVASPTPGNFLLSHQLQLPAGEG